MIRDARRQDLPAIVAIYNASIPGRLATADLEPVSIESRRAWFDAHHSQRPIWVLEEAEQIVAWLSLQSFYGRPAYNATAEVSIYVSPTAQRRGLAKLLLKECLERASSLGLTTLLGFIFGHNAPSLALFEKHGFARWGTLPRIAVLDGVERDLVIVGRRVG
jgi:phosphinothricin acetyltransferase